MSPVVKTGIGCWDWMSETESQSGARPGAGLKFAFPTFWWVEYNLCGKNE